jgi:hypothetical protein
VTAGTYDFNQQMKARMPIVFAFVLGLDGILVLVFQHTWVQGFTSNFSIASWLPLFLFVILFGLSMD